MGQMCERGEIDSLFKETRKSNCNIMKLYYIKMYSMYNDQTAFLFVSLFLLFWMLLLMINQIKGEYKKVH